MAENEFGSDQWFVKMESLLVSHRSVCSMTPLWMITFRRLKRGHISQL